MKIMRSWLPYSIILLFVSSCVTSKVRQKRQDQRLAIDCSKQNFKSHDTKCCTNSGRNLFTDDQLSACNSMNDKTLVKWANNYMLNSLQAGRNGNSIELNDWKISLKICAAADFLNCVFNSNGLLFSNGSVDMQSSIATFNETQNDDFWKSTISNGVPKFNVLVKDIMPETIKSISCPGEVQNEPMRTVSAIPFLWTQIVNGAFITHCPNQITKGGGCRKMIKNFNFCITKVEDFLLGQQTARIAAIKTKNIFNFQN
ncbi:uncharacterized protein LOC132196593 [Neocloeon triangulifer]|uniref:uncharacterized protein LOC132196593 n=1 Tax=Neocloeon triangulifer TaxID=2078957 RepID=UPI00286F0C02|nr:uncharacterized protein LOC132196593 [Neocloeon triangulifer]